MFKYDPKTRTITIQDENEKEIYPILDFVNKVNNVVYLMDDPYGNQHKNAFYTYKDNNEYNELLDHRKEISIHIGDLWKKLKKAHLPIVMPDAKSFIEEYDNRISNLEGEQFQQAVLKQAEEFMEALKHSNKTNVACAKSHGIIFKEMDEVEKTK